VDDDESDRDSRPRKHKKSKK
jgi:ALMS motif